MKSLHDFREIYLHKSPIDGRKLIRGLSAVAQGCMPAPPFSGALFVFTSRKRDTIKLLYWDRTGFALWIKQLQTERFLWPKRFDGDVVTLSVTQLEWLLDGLDITRMKPHETLYYSAVS